MIAEHGYAGCGGWLECDINGVKVLGHRGLVDVWEKGMENTRDNRAGKHPVLKREMFWRVLKLTLPAVTMYVSLFFDAIALETINGVADLVSHSLHHFLSVPLPTSRYS